MTITIFYRQVPGGPFAYKLYGISDSVCCSRPRRRAVAARVAEEGA